MTFKPMLQELEGGLKFIDITQNFKIFIRKKCNKIRSSPNLEKLPAHAQKNNIGGAVFYLFISCNLR